MSTSSLLRSSFLLLCSTLALPACLIADGGPLLGGWAASSHPCAGNRTDTLWRDDDGTLWVGCGTTTEGFGLYRSTDDGASWEAPDTDPPRMFDDFRVNSVSRSSDGVLYVAGTGRGARVMAVDTSVAPLAVERLLHEDNQPTGSFSVGTFRRNAEGFAVAESLTGADVVTRASDADDFVDAPDWDGTEDSFQMLDLELDGDGGFVGCGSTISQPPTLFFSSSTTPFTMTPLTAAEEFDGELWSIDVSDGAFTAGGVDQDTDVGILFSGPTSATSRDDLVRFDLDALFDDPTWVRGVCRDGDVVIAVGAFSTRGGGIVLQSDDGGASFIDISPDDAPELSECVVADGTVFVTGANGYFASQPL